MTEDRLVFLIANRMSGTLTGAELSELEEWMQHDPTHRHLPDLLLDDDDLEQELCQWSTIDPAAGHAKWMRRQETLDRGML